MKKKLGWESTVLKEKQMAWDSAAKLDGRYTIRIHLKPLLQSQAKTSFYHGAIDIIIWMKENKGVPISTFFDLAGYPGEAEEARKAEAKGTIA